MKNHKGFTLIEVMVIIGLIGIIASVVIPAIMGSGTEQETSVVQQTDSKAMWDETLKSTQFKTEETKDSVIITDMNTGEKTVYEKKINVKMTIPDKEYKEIMITPVARVECPDSFKILNKCNMIISQAGIDFTFPVMCEKVEDKKFKCDMF